jgi:two-component system sensor histidine kinase CreC
MSFHTFKLLAKNDQVLIKIEDSGVGIPEYARDKIFEKFYSLERPRSGKKSTGLGLSFIKEVLQLHEGTIAVESDYNKTIFKIVLPAYIS